MKKKPYTAIPNHAFQQISQLTGKSLYVYVLLRSKLIMRKGDSLTPLDNVVLCTYADAGKNGIFKTAFSRGIKQLIAIGLIKIEKKGSFGGRNPTQYKIL